MRINHRPFISAFVHGPRAVSRRSSEQGDRKSGCPSEASYLIFRPASVAKACEAHEALTFWLLLGQAKSDGKEILRFALNDKRPNANDANVVPAGEHKVRPYIHKQLNN
ncbi:hypothetical protein [Tannerella forsythia]